jgi:hypothetical protein
MNKIKVLSASMVLTIGTFIVAFFGGAKVEAYIYNCGAAPISGQRVTAYCVSSYYTPVEPNSVRAVNVCSNGLKLGPWDSTYPYQSTSPGCTWPGFTVDFWPQLG